MSLSLREKLTLPLWMILISVLLNIPICSGQQNGFIITAEGDTMHGTIRFNMYRSHPKEIKFIRTDNNRETIYHPGQVFGFHVPPDENYISAIVTMNISSIDMSKLQATHNQDTIITQTVFLLVLVRGDANLFYFVDSTNKEHFFIQKSGNPISELNVYYRFEKSSIPDLPDRFLVQDAYKTQLLNDLGACPGIDKLINNGSYSARSLVDVFEYYNNCIGGKSRYVQKKLFNKFIVHPGLIMGFADNSLIPSFNVTTPYNSTKQIIYGVSIEYLPKVFKNILSFYGDIHFKTYNTIFHAKYDTEIIDRQYIDLTYMVRVGIPLNDIIKFFVNAGGSSGLVNWDFDNYITPGDAPVLPNNTQFELVGGAGFEIVKHFSFEVRYSYGHQAGLPDPNGFNTHSIYILVGYHL